IKYFSYLLRNFRIPVKPGAYKNKLRAIPFGNISAHGTPYTKFTRFVTGGRYHTTLFTATNSNRLAFKLRIVHLFYRSIKSIHIYTHNFAKAYYFIHSFTLIKLEV